jgi:hypothetical protein
VTRRNRAFSLKFDDDIGDLVKLRLARLVRDPLEVHLLTVEGRLRSIASGDVPHIAFAVGLLARAEQLVPLVVVRPRVPFS